MQGVNKVSFHRCLMRKDEVDANEVNSRFLDFGFDSERVAQERAAPKANSPP